MTDSVRVPVDPTKEMTEAAWQSLLETWPWLRDSWRLMGAGLPPPEYPMIAVCKAMLAAAPAEPNAAAERKLADAEQRGRSEPLLVKPQETKMGTNFYLHEKPPCECCGRDYEPKHIGKSSSGWCFSLHVVPEDGINDLDDWITLWSKNWAYIVNEYGDNIDPETMVKNITERSRDDPPRWSSADYRMNYAEPGPKNLIRHTIGNNCIKHGSGTWDCITGEFS